MVKEALEKTHKARNYIIDEIILYPEPRGNLKYAPKMMSTVIPGGIREVIGSGGGIQKICAECDARWMWRGRRVYFGLDKDNCQAH
ncbi:MAG: hypothetical protein ACLS8R_08105 [Anaeromassilibacillus sp.]